MTDLHPIVAQMQPSPEQKPAITARGVDVIVTAGAGAGKTLTLVARYLSLVVPEGGDAPDLRSVVAITFTRKAAREMRNRVRLEVQRYLQNDSLDETERACWVALYNRLDAARIGTIHSLCGEILRHHPAEAGVDPEFEMLSEGQMGLLQAQVVAEALGWIVDSPALVPLFSLLGEQGVREVVGTLLKRRLDLAEIWSRLPGSPEDPDAAARMIDHWKALVDAERDRARDRFLREQDFQNAVSLLLGCDPLDITDKMAVQREMVLTGLGISAASSLSAFSCEAEALVVLDRINRSGGRQAAWRGGKDTLAEVKTALKLLQDLWKAHADAVTLELNALDEVLSKHMSLIRTVFDWVDHRYAMLKAERRALDFDDLEAGALALFQSHPDVVAAWRRDVSALLVDEFQDTNARQAQLFEQLNGGEGKLFTVGDAKQSIYRFRGADVTVFRGQMIQAGQNSSGLRVVNLATSYRAHRRLVDGLNALLAPVLGAAEDPQRPYLAPFAPLLSSRESPLGALQPPFIELHVTRGSKREGALDRAAEALVRQLVKLVEGDTGLGYGDIAILCRASSSFAAYEDALESLGVPFLTVAGRGFYERPEVRDVLNALQAIADPTDDLALAGLLRSPAIGLSDIALYRLVATKQALNVASLWDTLSGDISNLEDETTAALRARALIAKLNTLAGRVPIADVLKDFLDQTDYRAALQQARQTRGVHNLDKLLADAHASEIVDIAEFLEYVQQLRDVGTREGEAHVLSEGAVQLMTVHAAKGLEFPVVVIGDAARQLPGVRGPQVDAQAGLVPAIKARLDPDDDKDTRPAIYEFVKAREEDQDAAENDRLLYVAATRARDKLLISGTFSRGLTGWLGRFGLALGISDPADLTGGDDAEVDRVRAFTVDVAGHPVGVYFYPEAMDLTTLGGNAARLTEDDRPPKWTAPVDLPMLHRFVPDATLADEAAEVITRDPPRRVWRVVPPERQARAPSWVVGQIVHGALERWLFPEGDGDRYWAWAAAEASSCGITDEHEAQDAARRAARMLRRFQGTRLYEHMCAASRLYREVPYSLEGAGGQLENGVLDALFEFQDEWTLVEFKTDRLRDPVHMNTMLGGENNDYIRQVGAYLDAVERLLGQRPHPVLCFLDCGGRVQLVEDRW